MALSRPAPKVEELARESNRDYPENHPSSGYPDGGQDSAGGVLEGFIGVDEEMEASSPSLVHCT